MGTPDRRDDVRDTPDPVTPTRQPADGDVLVRLPASDRSWPSAVPPVPSGWVLTVTLGHPRLLPVDADRLVASGYRIVGAAVDHLPIGFVVDILVPRDLRLAAPAWWDDLHARAERIFDLRLGPVRSVLAAELSLHLRAHAG